LFGVYRALSAKSVFRVFLSIQTPPKLSKSIFIARQLFDLTCRARYYCTISVCPSVGLSRRGILAKRMHISWKNLGQVVEASSYSFFDPNWR